MEVSGRLGEFLDDLHACLRVAEVEAAFIRAGPDILPGRAQGIYALDPRTERPLAVEARGVSDAFLAEYEAVGRACDPVFAEIRRTLAPAASGALMSDRAWRAEPFYEVCLRGAIHHVLQAPLVVEGELAGTLNLASPSCDHPFTPTDCARLGLVARHVAVALRRAYRFEALERRSALYESALDRVAVPLTVTGPGGELVFANRAAETLLGRDTGRLQQTLVANAALLLGGGRRVVTDVASGPEGRPISLRSTLLAGREPAVLSFLYAGAGERSAPLPVLSPREQEIAELVLRGLSNRQIAEAAFITENTVKQHLKRIYAKLGIDSRAELAAAAAEAQAAATEAQRER
jgi:DNA-binding CsgD family transcriptional regulator/PAS domain-containing protein